MSLGNPFVKKFKEKRLQQSNIQPVTLRNVSTGHRVVFVDDGFSPDDPSKVGNGRRLIENALMKRAADGGRLFLLEEEYPVLVINKGRVDEFHCEPPFQAQGAMWSKEDDKRLKGFTKLYDEVNEEAERLADKEAKKVKANAKLDG